MSRQSPPKLKKTSRKTKPRAVKKESAVPRGSSRAGGESAEVQRANARSNAELLETIRRQEELLEHGHDCIMIQDVNSGIVFWNRGCEETYGWRKHEAQGQTSQRLLFTQFSATEEEARRSLMEKGLWEGELVHTTKDGKQITVESRQILQRDASGMPARIFEINRDITSWKHAEQSLRQLSARLLQLQDEERRRIARELHDSTGQLLAVLVMNLAALNARASKFDAATAELVRKAMASARQASDEIRTLSYLLHPPTLDLTGLSSALQWFVEGVSQRSSIQVDLQIEPDLGRLPQNLETTIFRVVQESLTNVLRHSGSPTVTVLVRKEDKSVRLEVADQGKGIEPAVLAALNTSGGAIGVGIRGMQERVRQLGGTLAVHTRGKGTTVTAILPISEETGGQDSPRADGATAAGRKT